MMGEILVLAEQRGGELQDVTFEMLTLANKLGKEHGLAVTALFLGHGSSDLAQQLTRACDTALIMEDPELANYNADHYLMALDQIIEDRMPFLTMVGNTSMGMDIVPALAARLSLPLATDCVEVTIPEKGRLEVLRQIYGGKINARLTMKPSDRYLIGLRTGSFDAEAEQGKSGNVETVPAPSWTKLRGRKFLTYLEAKLEDVDIASADILVSIGRGIGKPENIPIAQEFANSIGATLSCSRPVADEQWLPKSRQVGTSGKTVRPRLYIALGISGAYQHQAGMKNSDTIIAVNTDPKAPIFSIAHYGIVADMFEVMPRFTERFAEK
jgi:electron transfer flavoprotein alpha subunit